MSIGKHYVTLAFLKEKRIDYIYHPSRDVVSIPCYKCGNTTEMNLVTTSWSCICGQKGNLLTLIKYTNENAINKKIYNPKREKQKLKRLFLNLINSSDSSTQEKIQVLMDLVFKLLSYYENNTLQK